MSASDSDSNGLPASPRPDFKYDPKGTHLICAFFKLRQTVIPHVLRRFEFWMFLACHLAVHFSYSAGLLSGSTGDGPWSVNFTNLKVITMMTTFFEVFYTNQCYSRYLQIYRLTRHMLRKLPEFILDLRVNVPDPKFKCYIRLASRYLMSSLLLCFIEFTKQDGLSEEDWEELRQKGLLRPAEIQMLQRFDSDSFAKSSEKHLVLLHWTGAVTREAHLRSKAINNTFKDMFARLTAVLEMQQELIDMLELPVPFQYFHLLNMMVVVNLMLWAYAMGLSSSVWAPITFIFAEIIFMGMLELASQLADPFGEDEVDFPVKAWTLDYLKFTAVFIEQEYSPSEQGWQEASSAEKRLHFRDLQAHAPAPTSSMRVTPQSRDRGYQYMPIGSVAPGPGGV